MGVKKLACISSRCGWVVRSVVNLGRLVRSLLPEARSVNRLPGPGICVLTVIYNYRTIHQYAVDPLWSHIRLLVRRTHSRNAGASVPPK